MTAPATDPLAPYRSGSAEPWTARLLCELARAIDARVVIETGTYLGETTLALYQMLSARPVCSTLLTIELDYLRSAAFVERFKAAALPGSQCCLTIQQDDALLVLRRLSPGQADFIFLDDDHGTDHVTAEVRLALRCLRPRGLLCLHDVMGRDALCEVVRDYGGISLDLPRLHAGGGLGIIVKE